MTEDLCTPRSLFGGAIVSTFPLRFEDVSNIRQVPDHQEVFVDPRRDESLIFELLDLKTDVADQGSATWFLQDLARDQDAEGTMVLEQSGVFHADGLGFRGSPAIITTAVGQMELDQANYTILLIPSFIGISKGRQGRDAQNIVKVYLADMRLKDVGTDVLITAYEPMLINPLSESAAAVGAGWVVPAANSGNMPMAEVFKGAVTNFKVNEWGLFGSAA
ncbi:hypothetical protein OROGR_001385 [Orobanche gracilis]